MKPKGVPALRPMNLYTGLQIYGGPGSLSHDFEKWPITFKGSGPSGPILLVVNKSHFNKNIHFTASLQTQLDKKVHVGSQ